MAIVDLTPGGQAVASDAAAFDSSAGRAHDVDAQRGTPRAAAPSANAAGPSDVVRHCRDEPDERLVALCRGGHEDAFDEIVERYQALLLRHCAQIVGWAAAQDAVQDALLSAWRTIRGGAEIQTLRSWLFTVAHRKALTSLRDRRGGSFELAESLSGGRSAGDEAGQSARARETLAALAQLPESQREALLGTAVHGRSGREIASALGVNESTVRQLVFRARATLRTAAAACLVPPVFVIGLLRRVAGSPSRLAAVTRTALRPNQADTTVRILKGSALAIIGLTLAATGAVRVIASQPGPKSAPPTGVQDPTRRGHSQSATFAAARSPVQSVARSDVRRSSGGSFRHAPGHARHRPFTAGGGAPAVRSLGPSVEAPGSQITLASPTTPTLPDPATILAPPSLTTIVNGAPASGRRVPATPTPSVPPSVTHTAQNVTQASTTAAAQAGQSAGHAPQAPPGVALPAGPGVAPPAQQPPPQALAGITAAGP